MMPCIRSRGEIRFEMCGVKVDLWKDHQNLVFPICNKPDKKFPNLTILTIIDEL